MLRSCEIIDCDIDPSLIWLFYLPLNVVKQCLCSTCTIPNRNVDDAWHPGLYSGASESYRAPIHKMAPETRISEVLTGTNIHARISPIQNVMALPRMVKIYGGGLQVKRDGPSAECNLTS